MVNKKKSLISKVAESLEKVAEEMETMNNLLYIVAVEVQETHETLRSIAQTVSELKAEPKIEAEKVEEQPKPETPSFTFKR